MKPDDLLNDVLAEPALRERSLEQTLHALARHRVRARRVRAGGVCFLALFSLILLKRDEDQARSPAPITASAKPEVIPGTNIRLIGDEELLAALQDQPVALIGPAGHREVVFLGAPEGGAPN